MKHEKKKTLNNYRYTHAHTHTHTHTYSVYGKLFRPPYIFHSLLFCSHSLKSFKFIFFPSLLYTQHPIFHFFPLIIGHTASHLSFFPSLLYTQHTILTEKHRIVEIFAHLLKKKN